MNILFKRLFSLITGCSFADYVRSRRLSNAGQELYLGEEKNSRYCSKISI